PRLTGRFNVPCRPRWGNWTKKRTKYYCSLIVSKPCCNLPQTRQNRGPSDAQLCPWTAPRGADAKQRRPKNGAVAFSWPPAPGRGWRNLPRLLMRRDRRESLRAAVLLWNRPLLTPRCSSGCAVWKAACAADLSPPAIAISTFLRKVRMRERRMPLISARRALRRIRFSADLWFAILFLVHRPCLRRRAYNGAPRSRQAPAARARPEPRPRR